MCPQSFWKFSQIYPRRMKLLLFKDEKPFAKLLPISQKSCSARIPGLNKKQIWISDDFDKPLPDDFWLNSQ